MAGTAMFWFNGWKVRVYETEGEREVVAERDSGATMRGARLNLGPPHAPVEVEALPEGGLTPLALYGHHGIFFFAGEMIVALNPETALLYSLISPHLATQPEAAEIVRGLELQMLSHPELMARQACNEIRAAVRLREASGP